EPVLGVDRDAFEYGQVVRELREKLVIGLRDPADRRVSLERLTQAARASADAEGAYERFRIRPEVDVEVPRPVEVAPDAIGAIPVIRRIARDGANDQLGGQHVQTVVFAASESADTLARLSGPEHGIALIQVVPESELSI